MYSREHWFCVVFYVPTNKFEQSQGSFRIKIILRNSVPYFAIGKAAYKCIKCSSKHCSIENYSLSFNIEGSVYAYLMKELFFRVTIYTCWDIWGTLKCLNEILNERISNFMQIVLYSIDYFSITCHFPCGLFFFHLYLHLKFQKSVSLLVEI